MKWMRLLLMIAVPLSSAVMVQAADEAAPAAKPEAAAAPAAAPAAPTKDWSVTLGADYYSEYIFRGVDLLKNEPVFVPSVVAKWKNVTAYYYGYFGDGD